MSTTTHNSEAISLYECLHDGYILEIVSDLMVRTLTITVDAQFHWQFHGLPSETRFRVIGENVRIAEALEFEAWPGATDTAGMSWEAAQEQRRSDSDKARLVSTGWTDFVADIGTEEDHVILDANLNTDAALPALSLDVMSYPNSNFREVRVHAQRFRFYVGERELSLDEFQKFGEATWEEFAKERERRAEQMENGNV